MLWTYALVTRMLLSDANTPGSQHHSWPCGQAVLQKPWLARNHVVSVGCVCLLREGGYSCFALFEAALKLFRFKRQQQQGTHTHT